MKQRTNHFYLALAGALMAASGAQAAGISGAIFTTTANGAIVNANTQYASKCEVYLDGGPGPNAPAHAAGLPAGDYYFQVTDPNGKTLLNTDPVSNRRFTVSSAGVIVAFSGTGGPVHPIGSDQDHPELGAVTIRLANLSCPSDFTDTPSQGGVYKVWATRVADFIGNPALVDNACGGGCFHGFVSSKSKTDNFKSLPTQVTYCISVTKQIYSDGSVTPGVNWEIRLTDPLDVVNTYFTDEQGTLSVCGLAAGSYTVREMTGDYGPRSLTVNGLELPADSVYSFTLGAGNQPPTIVFQNEIAVPQ